MAKTPDIRFKGFFNDWEESTFGNKLSSMPYKQYIKQPELNGDFPVIQQGDDPVLGYAKGEPISQFNDKIIFGDHTVSLYRPQSPFFVATDGLRIFSMKGCPQSFLYTLFEKYKPKSHGYTRHTSYLNESVIKYPKDVNEQVEIGDFFEAFDDLINSKQEELDMRRQMKASLMKQMFPLEGTDMPSLRFKGFCEPWTAKKMTDLFDLSIKHYSHSRDNLTNIPQQVATIHYGDILVKYGNVVTFGMDDIPYIVSSKIEEYKSAALQDGDIIIADTAEDEVAGKVIEIRNVGANCVVAGLHTIAARPKVEFAPNYCGYFFNSPLYHNQLLPLMQGIKVLSINKPALEPTKVYFPSSLKEQEKIGNLFYDIDASISGIIEQMQKLRKIKKALLEGMLV